MFRHQGAIFRDFFLEQSSISPTRQSVIPWRWHPVAETRRNLIFALNCVLLIAFVVGYIDCKNIRAVNKMKICFFEFKWPFIFLFKHILMLHHISYSFHKLLAILRKVTPVCDALNLTDAACVDFCLVYKRPPASPQSVRRKLCLQHSSLYL